MNADRQIEIARGLIDRKKVRIVQGLVAFHAAEENADGAILFGPFQFLHRFFDARSGGIATQ